MIRVLITLLFITSGFMSLAQESLSEVLKEYNSETIPYISVDELAKIDSTTILLDARELSEYNTSHLQNAIHVGYENFDVDRVKNKIHDKDKKIVVYCSLGVRSEDVAEKLKKAGYSNIYNLFGGIFEWKNKDFTVYDTNKNPTEKVHAFSKKWGKWLLKGIKVYD